MIDITLLGACLFQVLGRTVAYSFVFFYENVNIWFFLRFSLIFLKVFLTFIVLFLNFTNQCWSFIYEKLVKFNRNLQLIKNYFFIHCNFMERILHSKIKSIQKQYKLYWAFYTPHLGLWFLTLVEYFCGKGFYILEINR